MRAIQIYHHQQRAAHLVWKIVPCSNGDAKENERFTVSSFTDGLKRVMADVEQDESGGDFQGGIVAEVPNQGVGSTAKGVG